MTMREAAWRLMIPFYLYIILPSFHEEEWSLLWILIPRFLIYFAFMHQGGGGIINLIQAYGVEAFASSLVAWLLGRSIL